MPTAADTRERIMETAWDLIRERGIADLTVAEIAAAAGVSRQLVYFHFANRAGLLVAMTRHQDARSSHPQIRLPHPVVREQLLARA